MPMPHSSANLPLLKASPPQSRGGESILAPFLIDLAIHSTGAESGWLLLPDRGDALVIHGARRAAADFGKQPIPMGEEISGRKFWTKKALLIPDVKNDQRYGKMPSMAGFAGPSVMILPLPDGEQLLGVLVLSGRTDGSCFTEKQFHFGRRLTAWAARQVVVSHAESATAMRKSVRGPKSGSAELLNRLNAIHGAVYYLRRGRNLSAERREEFLQLIASETRRLIALTEF